MSGLGHVCARWLLAIVMFWFFRTAFAAEVTVDLPQQDLKSALVDVSKTFDVQVLYSADLVEGLVSPPLHGRFTIDAALEQLLAETGLAFSHANPQTVLIVRQPQARVFHALEVTATRQLPAKGANGSRDVLATESSGRYAARGASVGSPAPQALKDVPRALSVIGQPQMQDEGLFDLADAVSVLPGVSVQGQASNTIQATVRGRTLDYYQLDGGAAMPLLYSTVSGDLAAYDRVELLRGPDGIGNGFAPPSGALNLVRKRPLDHAQFVVDAHTGSWRNDGLMLDATGPLAGEGHLRGRFVASGLDRDYFYDDGQRRRGNVYGVLEGDPTRSTLLRAGVQYERSMGTPLDAGGQPIYLDGHHIGLPRSTSFLFPWNREGATETTWFAALEQSFGADWKAVANMDRVRLRRDADITSLSGSIDPDTDDGAVIFNSHREEAAAYQAASLRLSGGFDWRGLEQRLDFDLSYADYRLRQRRDWDLGTLGDPVDIFHFDPADYTAPTGPYLALTDSTQRQRRYGASVVLTLNPWRPLTLTGALRWSGWQNRDPDAPLNDLPEAVNQHRAGPSYFGASWAFDAQWNIYASWADAYVANAALQMPDGRTVGPTVGDNYEVGLKFGAADGRLNAALALYRTERSHFPRRVPDDPDATDVSVSCCYDSGGNDHARAQGFEVEASGSPWPGWQLAASYAYNDADYRNTGGSVTLNDDISRGTTLDSVTPRHALRLFTVWEPQTLHDYGLRFGCGVRAQSAVLSPSLASSNDPTPDIPKINRAGYLLLDLMGGWRIMPAWQLTLNLRNVLDHRYYIATGYAAADFYGEPRSAVLGVRGSF